MAEDISADEPTPDENGWQRSEEGGFNRVTSIADDMIASMPSDTADCKTIVFVSDGNQMGIGFHGYEGVDDTTPELEAMADLLTYMKAVFEAQGRSFDLVFAPVQGQG